MNSTESNPPIEKDSGDENIANVLITVLFVVSLLLFTSFFAYLFYRKRKVCNRRYKMKERKLYFDEDLYGRKSNFFSNTTFPIPVWNSTRNEKVVAPLRGVESSPPLKNNLMSGVPTILMSSAVSSPIVTDKKTLNEVIVPLFQQLQGQFEDMAKWFLATESELLKEHANVDLAPGSIYNKLFSEDRQKFTGETGSTFDVYAIQYVLALAAHNHIFSNLGTSQYNVQCMAAYLKATKALSVPRSVISLLDFEVYGYMKEYLSRPNIIASCLEEKEELLNLPNLILSAIKNSQQEICNQLKLILPMTFTTTASDSESTASTVGEEPVEDPTNGRLQVLLFESLVAFFTVKAYNPLYSFKIAKTSDVFSEEWMEWKSVHNGQVHGGLSEAIFSRNGCKVKAQIF